MSTPSIPVTVYSVATLRGRLRDRLRDDAIPDPSNPSDSLPTVFSDDELNEAIREALSYISQYRKLLKAMPPLSLVANQASYDMPPDFAAPERQSWEHLLGPSSTETGEYPGSRYAREKMQDMMDSPNAFKGYGSEFGGFPSFWTGGVFTYPFGPVQYDAQGQIIPGCNHSRVDFLPPSAVDPNWQLVFNPPPPAAAGPFSGMLYYATYTVLRLVATEDGSAWATNEDGTLATSVVYAADEYNDDTDILGVGVNDDASRLVLLYATYWTLQSKIIGQDSDGETYAFYASRTGMVRKDMDKLANDCLKECERRTRKRAMALRA